MDDYGELRAVAARLLQNERDDHTLQPTALVHEAFLRAQGRDGFLDLDPLTRRAILAREMRWALVDHARTRNAQKRGRGRKLHVTLDEAIADEASPWIEVIALDRALERLEAFDPFCVKLVELRFYGGLSEYEVAEHMGCSRRWVQKKWAWTKSWLRRELEE